MKKHQTEFKLEVVKTFLAGEGEGEGGAKQLARQFFATRLVRSVGFVEPVLSTVSRANGLRLLAPSWRLEGRDVSLMLVDRFPIEPVLLSNVGILECDRSVRAQRQPA